LSGKIEQLAPRLSGAPEQHVLGAIEELEGLAGASLESRVTGQRAAVQTIIDFATSDAIDMDRVGRALAYTGNLAELVRAATAVAKARDPARRALEFIKIGSSESDAEGRAMFERLWQVYVPAVQALAAPDMST
jgi:hypothetical protein